MIVSLFLCWSDDVCQALLPVGPVPVEVLHEYEELVLKYCHVRNDSSSLQERNVCGGTKGVGNLFCFLPPN